MLADSYWLPASWQLAGQNGVLGFTTTRHGGSSIGAFTSNNIRFGIGDSPSLVSANRSRLLATIDEHFTGVSGSVDMNEHRELSKVPVKLQWLDQVHGDDWIYADAGSLDTTPQADAAWTDKRGVGIAIQTADCIPILITDRDATIVGAAHAGWRGLVSNVAANLVAAMPKAPEELVAWLGPCIGPKYFEVGEDVWSEVLPILPEAVHVHNRDASKRFVDLLAVAKRQLRQCGVGAVSSADICTYASNDFYSYRQACHLNDSEGSVPAATGRMASIVALRP